MRGRVHEEAPMRKDEEQSHRIIDGWGEGVVIREPMGKDRGEITVGQMGRGSTQGRGEPQGKQ